MTANQPVETWNTKWADFVIVVKTGEELKCHKVLIAKASPYFEALLSTQDTETNKIEANDFTLKTVSTFLEYIYAGFERVPKHALHKKQIDKAQPKYLSEGGSKHALYKKQFDRAKITPQLLRMCHTYQVTSLLEECSEHLMKTISDTNVVSIWMEAERCEITVLKNCALKYISRKKERIGSLPGIDEAYKCPELVKTLVEFLGRHFTSPGDAVEHNTAVPRFRFAPPSPPFDTFGMRFAAAPPSKKR